MSKHRAGDGSTISVEHTDQARVLGAGDHTIKLALLDKEGKEYKVVIPVPIELQRFVGERIGRAVNLTVRLADLDKGSIPYGVES